MRVPSPPLVAVCAAVEVVYPSLGFLGKIFASPALFFSSGLFILVSVVLDLSHLFLV